MTYHQPVISLHTGAIVEYEAVPSRAMTTPGEAGTAAVPSRLDPGVLRSSVAFLVAARSLEPMMDVRVSVNVPAHEFADGTFAPDLLDQLQTAGVPPSSFQVELADRFDDDERFFVRRSAGLLQERGVRLAFDQFGREPTDLRTLGELDFDCIKLAPALTAGHLDPHGVNILRSVVRLADRIGVEVVATGIDLAHQHERLVQVECAYGQGDFYAPLHLQPHPMEAVGARAGAV